MSRITLAIEGMSCGHCVHAVSHALTSLPGVTVQAVQIGSATVDFDEAKSSVESLLDAVADAGYSASPEPTQTLA